MNNTETAIIGTMKLLSDIRSPVQMSVLTNSNVSKNGFFEVILLKRKILSH